MNKISFSVMVLMLFTLSSFIVYGSPSPDEFAINPVTKECGGFNAGDEFTEYALPDGWTTYRYDSNSRMKSNTCIEGTGECAGKFHCVLNNTKQSYCWDSKETCENVGCEGYAVTLDVGTCYVTGSTKTCCTQLGYKFISNNVGQKTTPLIASTWNYTMWAHPGKTIITSLIIIALIIFGIVKYLKIRKSIQNKHN
jgi:hypothetical protein